MTIDLFPTDALMRALDEPGSLIDDLDYAGGSAAAAFDAERGTTRERARAFTDVLVADPHVPRATRKRLVKAMPAWWEAIVHRAREGALSSLVMQLEAEELLRQDSPAVRASVHPVLAYVNEVGIAAAERAFDAYRAALPPALLAPAAGTLLSTESFERATSAANEQFISALGARVAGDAFAFFQREAPPAVFWTTIVASAAGGLGALIVGPKLLTDGAASLGLAVPPLSGDVDVASFSDGVKLRFGASVRLVPGGLTDGPLWRQALDNAFGATARLGLRFGDEFDLTTAVHWAPEDREWGVKLTFTLLRF